MPTEDEADFGATVAALAAGQLVCWAALFYAFTSFVLPMQRELGWSRQLLMGAFTCGLAVCGLAAYAVGAAIDRGRERLVLAGGALLGGAGFAGWAVVTAPWMLYAAWCALGAAMAMTLYEPAFAVLARRYPTRFRDGIVRLTLVGGFASTLSFPAVVGLMGALGWRGALWAIGAVLALAVAPLHAWALRRPARPVAPAAGAATPDPTLREALRTPAFWLLTAAFTIYTIISTAFWAHAVPALAAKGRDAAAATAVLVWFGPAQVAGRFAHLVFGRGLDLKTLGTVVLVAVPASFALFALAHETPALVAFAVLFGIANGLVTIVRGAIVPEFFGRAHIGRISGAMATVALLARAVAPLGAALLLLAVDGYRDAMLVLAALGLAAAGAFAAARRA